MIGGKAFATYTNAKRIVKLVIDVGDVVNSDPDVNNYLKVSSLITFMQGLKEGRLPSKTESTLNFCLLKFKSFHK